MAATAVEEKLYQCHGSAQLLAQAFLSLRQTSLCKRGFMPQVAFQIVLHDRLRRQHCADKLQCSGGENKRQSIESSTTVGKPIDNINRCMAT